MCQTLFFIPDRLFGLPVFGFGLLLLVWGVVSAAWIGWLMVASRSTPRAWQSHVLEILPFLGLIGFAIVFVFPRLEAQSPSGAVLGLPIRGYGTFLLVAVGAGWWLSARRAVQRGLSLDTLASLAFHMFVAGIFGARLFFVIEYWDNFRQPTWAATIMEAAKFTEGGLVVYGSIIGAFLAYSWFSWRRGLSVLAVGDIIAPGAILGMAIGRLGCLMNGCCYGGLCEEGPWGIEFPRFSSVAQQVTSPPYLHQLSTGRLHGFSFSENASGHPVVTRVEPKSPAERSGLTVGSRLAAINGVSTPTVADAEKVMAHAGADIVVQLADGQPLHWSIPSLPPRSRPVHPSQVYSAISGLLICLVLLSSEPFWNRTGALVAMFLTLYPLLRFLEEMIRDDEPGQLGTDLTISQWISLAVLAGAVAVWAVVLRSGGTSITTSATDITASGKGGTPRALAMGVAKRR